MKSNFNIQDDDDKIIREKITKGLNYLGIDEQSVVPYFLELLSVKDSGINTLQMSPDAMKDKVARALKLIIQKFSEIKPLVLMLEDLHWADQSSIEIINQFIEIVPGARVIIIVAHRPEFVSTWGKLSYHSQVTLYKLTTKQIFIMVDNILKLSRTNDEFLDFIVSKTEGIPFFIEEFIKYLKDQKLIEKKAESYVFNKDVHKVNVPSTIQDVIMARTDRLPEKAKEILKIASAVEREFSSQLIINLVDYPESELLSQLAVLKDSELIFERGIFPESIYVFKHALIRDTIYTSILSEKKKQYHEKIGDTMEKLFQDLLPEYFEILAEHFALGENFIKGADYYHVAYKKILKTASSHDAIKYTVKRIECLEKLKQNNDIQKQIIDTRIVLGFLYTQINNYTQAMQSIQPILEIAEEKTGNKKNALLYTILGGYQYNVEENFPEAFKSFKKALELAEKTNDLNNIVSVSYWLGLVQARHCEFEQAEHNLNKGLEANQTANILWGVSFLKSLISYFVHYYEGFIEKGFNTSHEAIRFADESQDTYAQSIAYVVHGVLCYCKGSYDKAEKYLLKGSQFCETSNNFAFLGAAQLHLGELNYETKKYDDSFNAFNQSVDWFKKTGFGVSLINLGLIGAAMAQSAMRGQNINFKALTKLANTIKSPSFEGWKLRFLSQILINIGKENYKQAEELIQKAIQADTKNRMNFSLGKDYYTYSQLLVKLGDPDKAKINYKKAEETFKQCGADKYLETIDSYK